MGICASTVVPPPGVGSISSVPPTAAARSRMPASPIIRSVEPVLRTPDAIVFDNEHEVLVALFQQDVDRLCMGVLGDIVQRFLRDPIDACLDL